jgi:hypothetical protein
MLIPAVANGVRNNVKREATARWRHAGSGLETRCHEQADVHELLLRELRLVIRAAFKFVRSPQRRRFVLVRCEHEREFDVSEILAKSRVGILGASLRAGHNPAPNHLEPHANRAVTADCRLQHLVDDLARDAVSADGDMQFADLDAAAGFAAALKHDERLADEIHAVAALHILITPAGEPVAHIPCAGVSVDLRYRRQSRHESGQLIEPSPEFCLRALQQREGRAFLV